MFEFKKHLFPTLVFLLMAMCLDTLAQSKHTNLDKNGLAIQGYDPVSYFINKEPKKGSPQISYSYAGSLYYFSDNKNKTEFVSQPLKYLPKYGGWCAYAIGVDGSKVKIDPETFKIKDGKLYLFYNFFPVNTLKKWNDNEEQLSKTAETQWSKIISQE